MGHGGLFDGNGESKSSRRSFDSLRFATIAQDDSFYEWMRALFRGCLFSAADYDSCAGRDHGASVGNLLAGCAIADDLDFEACGSGLLCAFSDRQGPQQREPPSPSPAN